MDFAERLSALATKVAHQKAALETEEATKNAFVMPFISTILGYDVFNPSEVVPEFTADVGVKKGEKYHFYTDLDAPNRMDAKPFLVLDLLDIDTTLLPELLKLSKTEFDLDSIISAAGELKYVGQIKRAIAAEFKDPSDDWIRFFTNRVYEGAFTQKVREQFTPLVGKASQQFLNEQVNNRLATALGAGSTPPPLPPEGDSVGEIKSQEEAVRDLEESQEEIITTAEELSAFNIVRAIVCNQVDMSRVSYRDAKSYCAILLDNNNRKTIARLHFNRSQKYIGILDENKIETRHPLDALEQIYTLSDQLRATVERLSA